jgi:hypothetical protein
MELLHAGELEVIVWHVWQATVGPHQELCNCKLLNESVCMSYLRVRNIWVQIFMGLPTASVGQECGTMGRASRNSSQAGCVADVCTFAIPSQLPVS